MDIWDSNKLIIFIMFAIPGFICVKIYRLIYPSQGRDAGLLLYDAVTYSCINYAALSGLIYFVESSDVNQIGKAIFYFFVVFIFPIIMVLIWKKIRTVEFVNKLIFHPSDSPWDYVFSQRKKYWVEVYLKDGSVVAGYYGSKSFASASPEEKHIYLEQRWVTDQAGAFERAVNRTAGVIVLHSEISHIEFRETDSNNQTERKGDAE